MHPTSEQRAYLELHIAVFLFGFTAILGDLIQLSAVELVWWRVLLTSISLLFLIQGGRSILQASRKTILQFMGIGLLVAIHWVTFYGAIKLANASVALVAMATTSFFTSLLEPLFTRRRIKGYELLLGLLIIPGMFLIVNGADFSLLKGLLVGLLSAFLAALFGTLNKLMISKMPETSITFLELGSAWIFLSFVLPFYYHFGESEVLFWPPRPIDWLYILVLALLCTTLAYVLSLRALRHLSAFAANLTINLEPVYGIGLAFFLLNDSQELGPQFYLGVMIIMLAVLSYPVLRNKYGR